MPEIQQVQDAAGSLAAKLRRLVDTYNAEEKGRRVVLSRLDPVDVQIGNMERDVNARATAFWARVAIDIVHGFSTIVQPQQDGTYREDPPRMWSPHPLSYDDLCGLAPDLVKAQLANIIRSLTIAPGLPAPDRVRELLAADGRKRQIEDQHTEVVEAARSVGITLPLLPAVQARRDAEARQLKSEAHARELQEQWQEQQNEIARPADDALQPLPLGESSYLAANRRRRDPFSE